MNLNDTSLINFTKLCDTDKLLVLDWRNDEYVRKWMHSSGIISEKEHFAFIQILKTEKTKQFYLVANKDKYIGVIYFTNINMIGKAAEFGIYSNPTIRGKGKILMNSICEYGFNVLKIDKLTAEVFKANEKAIRLYSKFNFQKTDRKIVNSQEIICMELKNKNK